MTAWGMVRQGGLHGANEELHSCIGLISALFYLGLFTGMWWAFPLLQWTVYPSYSRVIVV
jgi:hypothetical protein